MIYLKLYLQLNILGLLLGNEFFHLKSLSKDRIYPLMN